MAVIRATFGFLNPVGFDRQGVDFYEERSVK